MAGNPHAMAELRALLSARQSVYEQAELTVDTSTSSVAEVVDRIAVRFEPDDQSP